jgi:hypothetical protein
VYAWTLASQPTYEPDESLRFGNTSDEYIKLQGLDMKDGTMYFICVRVVDSIPSLLRWHHCSLALKIDITPPMVSHVRLSTPHLAGLHSANSQAIALTYQIQANDLADINVLVGFRPGMDQVLKRAVEHLAGHGVVLDRADLPTGVMLYATVTATDHAGNHHSAYSSGFVVDTTPPYTTGSIIATPVTTAGAVYLDVSFDEFEDDETDIELYQLALGSTQNQSDIVAFHDTNCCTTQLPLEDSLHGDVYATVCATNSAGLTSCQRKYVAHHDSTPPTIQGQLRTTLACSHEGLTPQSLLTLNWSDVFEDHESHLIEFEVMVGLVPDSADLYHTVTSQEHIRTTLVRVAEDGAKLLVAVRALNSVFLWSTWAIVAVMQDCSPPLRGAVVDRNEFDAPYHASRSFFRALVEGFIDPHCDIRNLEYCLTTDLSLCNVLGWTASPSHTEITHTFGTNVLEDGSRYIVRVRVTNEVGLSTEGHSHGFQIDLTPPTITNFRWTHEPRNPSGDRSVFRSAVIAEWTTGDATSGVRRSAFALGSHHSSTSVDGLLAETILYGSSIRQYGLRLEHGDEYFPTITAWDGAGHLTQATLAPLSIDVTPPLAMKLHHASNWQRRQNNDLVIVIKATEPVDSEGTPIVKYYISVAGQLAAFDTFQGNG